MVVLVEVEQTEVHEFLGSVKLAEECEDRHNHRFAGVSGQQIPIGRGQHVHEIATNTDFLDHFHQICVTTEPAIFVGNDKHVHFATGFTTFVDGHMHEFQFATLIDSPLTPIT